MSYREGLILRLRAVANESRDSGEKMAATVLFTLCGALDSGNERALSDLCGSFSVAEIERLTGQPDWTDDTLKV